MIVSMQRVCLLSFICFVGQTFADITITPTKSVPGPITIGDSFDIDIDLTGWDSGTDGGVDGISLDVDFDNSILSVVSVTGDTTASAWLAQTNQQASLALTDDSFSGGGTVAIEVFDDAVDASAGTSVAASGPIGSITFQAIAVGSSNITVDAPFSNNSLIFSDAFGTFLPSTAISLGSTSMTVVPEPSIGLILSIVGIGLIGRKSVANLFRSKKFVDA